jgi:hypothetical protein
VSKQHPTTEAGGFADAESHERYSHPQSVQAVDSVTLVASGVSSSRCICPRLSAANIASVSSIAVVVQFLMSQCFLCLN